MIAANVQGTLAGVHSPKEHSRCGLPSAFRAAAISGTIAFSLAGCTTPAVKVQTVEVKVPVAIQPIVPNQVPAVPAPLGPRPNSLSAAADALLSKVCEFESYALRADPLLRLSAGEKPQALPPYPECER